jgi:hypothetical protein
MAFAGVLLLSALQKGPKSLYQPAMRDGDADMLDNITTGTIVIEDLEIGMKRSLQKIVTDHDIELFAEVSTDRNPVHLDDDYARDTIFEGRIAHGMLTAGLISAVIGEQLPGPWHGLPGPDAEVHGPRAPRRHGACRGRGDGHRLRPPPRDAGDPLPGRTTRSS